MLRVKTVGDAVMMASGLNSVGTIEDVEEIADLALELSRRQFHLAYTDDRMCVQLVALQFRFGMHCGEVVAGIVSKVRALMLA